MGPVPRRLLLVRESANPQDLVGFDDGPLGGAIPSHRWHRESVDVGVAGLGEVRTVAWQSEIVVYVGIGARGDSTSTRWCNCRRSGSHHLAFYFVVACEITKKSSLRSQVRSKSLYSRRDAIAAAHQLYIVVFGRGETLFAQSLSNVVVGANHVFMQVMPGQLIQRAREPKRHVQGAGGCPRLRLWSRAVQ